MVVNSSLKNIPNEGIYNWDPGAHFGIYRPDTFWFKNHIGIGTIIGSAIFNMLVIIAISGLSAGVYTP